MPRNVGLKAVWIDGAWSVQVVFMDHELTNIIGKRLRHFHPRTALAGMHMDRPRQQEFLWLTYAASGQECPQAALANPMRHLFLMLLSASGLWYEAVVANAGKDQ